MQAVVVVMLAVDIRTVIRMRTSGMRTPPPVCGEQLLHHHITSHPGTQTTTLPHQIHLGGVIREGEVVVGVRVTLLRTQEQKPGRHGDNLQAQARAGLTLTMITNITHTTLTMNLNPWLWWTGIKLKLKPTLTQQRNGRACHH